MHAAEFAFYDMHNDEHAQQKTSDCAQTSPFIDRTEWARIGMPRQHKPQAIERSMAYPSEVAKHGRQLK